MAQPELFERRRKIVARKNSLLRWQNELRANQGRLFLAQFHLMLKFSQSSQTQPKNVRDRSSAKAQHDNQHNRKATIHSFPLPLAKLDGSLRLAAQRPKSAAASDATQIATNTFVSNHDYSQTRIQSPASNRVTSRSAAALLPLFPGRPARLHTRQGSIVRLTS